MRLITRLNPSQKKLSDPHVGGPYLARAGQRPLRQRIKPTQAYALVAGSTLRLAMSRIEERAPYEESSSTRPSDDQTTSFNKFQLNVVRRFCRITGYPSLFRAVHRLALAHFPMYELTNSVESQTWAYRRSRRLAIRAAQGPDTLTTTRYEQILFQSTVLSLRLRHSHTP